MTDQPHAKPVSRRTTLAALAAAGLGASVASRTQAASARQERKDYSDHVFFGSWFTLALPSVPGGAAIRGISQNHADGTTNYTFPLTQVGANGVEYVAAMAGTWEPHDDRTGHFTGVQFLSDAEGNLRNIVVVDGYPQVSDDGMSFIDDGHLSTITIHDGTGNVMMVIAPGELPQPVTAVRMTPGNSGFPADATPEASPES